MGHYAHSSTWAATAHHPVYDATPQHHPLHYEQCNWSCLPAFFSQRARTIPYLHSFWWRMGLGTPHRPPRMYLQWAKGTCRRLQSPHIDSQKLQPQQLKVCVVRRTACHFPLHMCHGSSCEAHWGAISASKWYDIIVHCTICMVLSWFLFMDTVLLKNSHYIFLAAILHNIHHSSQQHQYNLTKDTIYHKVLTIFQRCCGCHQWYSYPSIPSQSCSHHLSKPQGVPIPKLPFCLWLWPFLQVLAHRVGRICFGC